jgi:hypothetical protein
MTTNMQLNLWNLMKSITILIVQRLSLCLTCNAQITHLTLKLYKITHNSICIIASNFS